MFWNRDQNWESVVRQADENHFAVWSSKGQVTWGTNLHETRNTVSKISIFPFAVFSSIIRVRLRNFFATVHVRADSYQFGQNKKCKINFWFSEFSANLTSTARPVNSKHLLSSHKWRLTVAFCRSTGFDYEDLTKLPLRLCIAFHACNKFGHLTERNETLSGQGITCITKAPNEFWSRKATAQSGW